MFMSINFRLLTSKRKLFDNENKANYGMLVLYTKGIPTPPCLSYVPSTESGTLVPRQKTRRNNVNVDKQTEKKKLIAILADHPTTIAIPKLLLSIPSLPISSNVAGKGSRLISRVELTMP